MQVNQAFRRRNTAGERGWWGNETVEEMLERHPWLKPLVEELRAESTWSNPHAKDEREWTALFFEDALVGRPTAVTLEIKPSRLTLQVRSMPLKPETAATLRDVERWIIANIRRNSR